MIWRFPEIGVPPVLIHFRLGFSFANHLIRSTPISGNLHIVMVKYSLLLIILNQIFWIYWGIIPTSFPIVHPLHSIILSLYKFV